MIKTSPNRFAYNGKGYSAGLNRGAEEYKQSLIKWLEGEKNIPSNHPELGIFAEECDCPDCSYDIGFKRTIDKVINHIKEQ